MIFTNKYKRRIEIARWKANIKLKEIEKDQLDCDMYSMIKQMGIKGHLKAQIELLNDLLKGKDIEF